MHCLAHTAQLAPLDWLGSIESHVSCPRLFTPFWQQAVLSIFKTPAANVEQHRSSSAQKVVYQHHAQVSPPLLWLQAEFVCTGTCMLLTADKTTQQLILAEDML